MASEMPPLIITATPNKSWLNPELPYPEAIGDVAAEAERCVASGASILHLHSVSEWVPLIAAVRAVAGDALIQCGMSSLLLDERLDIYEQGADMISIIASHHAEAFPEGDFDVLHPMTELLRYCKLCTEHDVRPEFEIWHSGSIWNLEYLLGHAELARPVINTLFFGWPGGTWTPPTIEEYLARRRLMPPDCVVTVSVMGQERYGILAAAITSGDHVRVGTEDYGYDRWGKPAQASELVTELTALAEALGRPVATPEEARKMLAFSPGPLMKVPEAALPPADRARLKPTTFVWLSPAVVLLAVLFLVPVGYAIYLGFTNLELLGPFAQHFSFTGLANLDRMVHDPVFWLSVRLTLIFVIGSGIVAQTVVGLALALLGQRAHVTVRVSVGAIVILAWVLPEITVAFLWYTFAQAGGTLSYLIGHPKTNLLASAPLLIVCVANAWRGTAFSMLVLSAGLRNVPAEVDEAAQLEGASYWRRLLRVTLPIMRPTIMTNMLLITLGTISDFTLIFVMTQGGPGNSTAILPVYMYVEAFQFNALGYGTAIALTIVLIGALLSIVYIRQLRPELAKAKEAE